VSDHRPRIGVVTFPGSLDDRDALRAVAVMGGEPVSVWHTDRSLANADAIILPGGFSYGDYLRTGAIARFAPAMESVAALAAAGGPVLGICNGFQILCEAGLLPGALVRNKGLAFVCRWVTIRVEPHSNGVGESSGAPDIGRPGELLSVPIKHGEGRFVAASEELARLEEAGQIALRYCSPTGDVSDDFNPNGSAKGIAGVWNEAGNVLGLMPHPEHAVDPDLGATGGQPILQWLVSAARARVPA